MVPFEDLGEGGQVLRALAVEWFNGKGRNVEISRPAWTETPEEPLATVIPLPTARRAARIIRPLDVPAQRSTETEPLPHLCSYDPGPLARALMAMAAADQR